MTRIDVTQQDIDDGVRRSAFECPVALALARVTGDRYVVNPYGPNDNVRVNKHHRNDIIIPHSAWMSELLYKFDSGETMPPFSFEVNLNQSDDEEE